LNRIKLLQQLPSTLHFGPTSHDGKPFFALFFAKRALLKPDVRRIMSDMKTLTMRNLNRKTASVLDEVERGEIFELRRNGRTVGYITQTPPTLRRKPDWKAHFDWLRTQNVKSDVGILAEFEEERRRQAVREKAMGNLK